MRNQGFLQTLKTWIPSKTLLLVPTFPKWQPFPCCLLFAPLHSHRSCAAAANWALLVLSDSHWHQAGLNAVWSSNNFLHILAQASDSLEHPSSRPFWHSAHCPLSVLSLWRAAGGQQDHLCGYLLLHTAPQSVPAFFHSGKQEACSNNRSKVKQASKWMSDLINVKEDDNSSNYGQNNCKADLQLTRIIPLLHF